VGTNLVVSVYMKL